MPCPARGDTARDDPSPTPCPATNDTAATGHTGRRDRRRTIRHATTIACPDISGHIRKCPEMPGNARTMVGYSRRCLTSRSVRRLLYGMRAAQRSASGAPLAGMEIGTDVSTGRIRKTPRLTGRASGVTCTRLLGGRLTITHQIRLYNKEFTIVVSINYKRP